MTNKLRKIATTTLLCLVAQSAVAVTNGERPKSTDTRFDAVGALALDKYFGQAADGENVSQHNWWCTVTLISENVILTAKHCIDNPDKNWMVRFRRQVDGSLGTIEEGADSFFHASVDTWEFTEQLSDVAIGYLSDSVTHIDPIPTITRGQIGAIEMPVIQAGWGKEGPNHNEGPRRELLLCHNFARSASVAAITTLRPDVNGCGINMHDSGGPILFTSPTGELRVASVVRGVTGSQSLRALDGVEGTVKHNPFNGVDFNIEPSVSQDSEKVKPGDTIRVALRGGDYGSAKTPKAKVEVMVVNGTLVEFATDFNLAKESYNNHVEYDVVIPENTPPNTYDLYAAIDPFDNTDEISEDNNETRRMRWLTVTPVEHTAQQISYASVAENGTSIGHFTWAVEKNGEVTVVGGVAGDRKSLRVFPQGSGPIKFKSNGISFALTKQDGLLKLTCKGTGYQIWGGSDIDELGPAGHVHGVYRGIQLVGNLRVPVRMIVAANRLTGIGTEMTPPTTIGNVGAYDTTSLNLPEIGEGRFVWNSASKTFRVDISGEDSNFSLYLASMPSKTVWTVSDAKSSGKTK
jgi:hypothetical protein